MDEHPEACRFKALALPHLDAAYGLARWLLRDRHDAEEAVQEAYLAAFAHFAGYRGGDARAWILAIVRNACYARLRQRARHTANGTAHAEPAWDGEDAERGDGEGTTESNPETLLLRELDRDRVRRAVESLPVEYRLVIVLREFEDLSYKRIAEVAGIPIGTVMSRLARARALLHRALTRDA